MDNANTALLAMPPGEVGSLPMAVQAHAGKSDAAASSSAPVSAAIASGGGEVPVGLQPMQYPGGKGGCYQQIINRMPPHHTYIETHLGGGNVLARKRPAGRNIGVDIDPEVCGYWHRQVRGCQLEVMNADAVTVLKGFPFRGGELVYADPPYLLDTRRGGELYRFEYSRDQHVELLRVLVGLPCYVMISGYASSLYTAMLPGWHRVDFQAATRRGPATESLWMNFVPNGVLHEYTYVGRNFRERERIKRKRERWARRLRGMGPEERGAIMAELVDIQTAEMPVIAAPASNAGSTDGAGDAAPENKRGGER